MPDSGDQRSLSGIADTDARLVAHHQFTSKLWLRSGPAASGTAQNRKAPCISHIGRVPIFLEVAGLQSQSTTSTNLTINHHNPSRVSPGASSSPLLPLTPSHSLHNLTHPPARTVLIMAETATAPTTTANPQSPVPLDTIPISPADGTNGADGKTDDAQQPVEYVDTDPVTVFHDPENFNVKHPLMHEWTLWFTKPPSGKVR